MSPSLYMLFCYEFCYEFSNLRLEKKGGVWWRFFDSSERTCVLGDFIFFLHLLPCAWIAGFYHSSHHFQAKSRC